MRAHRDDTGIDRFKTAALYLSRSHFCLLRRRSMTGTMRVARMRSALLMLAALLMATPAAAQYRITRDHGGLVEAYKARYEKIRDRGERVVIDGICNSACTLVLGIVPLNRICVTPRASLGVHEAYLDKRWTGGIRIASTAGTSDLLSYYPAPLKSWIRRHGGLKPQMQHIKNGPALWAIVDPCPSEF
jgi:hypothetical protein